MQHICSALAPLSNEPSCETGSFSHWDNPHHSPPSALSLSFLFSQPQGRGPSPCCGFSPSACLTSLVGLGGLVDCFSNSLVVRVPCHSIFWHFWLFFDFRLVVILLLVVRGSKGLLPIPPSWLELRKFSQLQFLGIC